MERLTSNSSLSSIVPSPPSLEVTIFLNHSMAISIASSEGSEAPNWADFYINNRNDNGPYQVMFSQTFQSAAERTAFHLGNSIGLTETIVGSANGNMIVVPGSTGIINILHHGFGATAAGNFLLIFAQGSLEDGTIFKSIPRMDVVTQLGNETGRRSGGQTLDSPSLASMLSVESADAFASLASDPANQILRGRPNHAVIIPQVFFLAEGARSFSAKELAFAIITRMLRIDDEDNEEITAKKVTDQGWAESLLAFLWASDQKGMLAPIQLEDVPDSTVMNHNIRIIKDKLRGGPPAAVTPPGAAPPEGVAAYHQMEVMAASSQNLISILNRMQDGNEREQVRKDADKSILKAMGPAQRDLFLALSTQDMSTTPTMSDFMKNLTSSKTPQKAISLIQSEARDWEGTFSVGGMHKLLSNGLMSQEANRANPGGFSIFLFYPRSVEIHGNSKGRNELLREYLGMDVDETTLEFYSKQGYFTPKSPSDLRVQLQTALSMLELLTCKKSIATRGLDYVLQDTRWTRMTTIYNDRFRTEKDFGTKFCYTLDRTLQIFFDRATRWTDAAVDGEPDYLRRKAEYLIDRIEDGRSLSIILPTSLQSSSTAAPTVKKRETPTGGGQEGSDKKPKKTVVKKETAETTVTRHANDATVAAWALPDGKVYSAVFGPQMASVKGWPYFVDNRNKNGGRPRRAPMCVRYQTTGECSQGCTLAHIKADDMPETDRRAVEKRFTDIYN